MHVERAITPNRLWANVLAIKSHILFVCIQTSDVQNTSDKPHVHNNQYVWCQNFKNTFKLVSITHYIY